MGNAANTTIPYATDAVTSADGTTIGYRRLGAGPGVILLHGGMEASQHLMRLAAALSDGFTVYVPDRRGRGLSGPFGEHYSVARECEDVAALVAATGAGNIFGLSSGALIALRAALVVPGLERAALYEPPLSLGGSAPISWVPRYDREVTRGQLARALATAIKGNPVEPALAALPRPLLLLLLALSMRAADAAEGDDVSVRALVPTQHYDMVVVRETANTLPDYAALRARVLLLGGSKSPAFLKTALDALARTLPHAERVPFPGLGHLGPTDDGRPETVAAELRRFFAADVD
jgi:pimeloyl-ACP methyl ester carboxylesterase